MSYFLFRRSLRGAIFVAAGVVSHWFSTSWHRPDMPVLPSGPHLGLGLWNAVAATVLFEITIPWGYWIDQHRMVRAQES